MVPSTAPSLRVERSRRDRCSGSRVLLVGGSAGNNSIRKVDVVVAVVVADMSSFVEESPEKIAEEMT